MIKYNWEKVKKIGNYDIIKVLQYFCLNQHIYVPNYLPRNFEQKIYKVAKHPLPIGYSYIIDIESLLLNREDASISEIYEYIDLASARSLFDYTVRNIKTLPVVFADNEITNRLLTIDNNQIYFKYE